MPLEEMDGIDDTFNDNTLGPYFLGPVSMVGTPESLKNFQEQFNFPSPDR